MERVVSCFAHGLGILGILCALPHCRESSFLMITCGLSAAALVRSFRGRSVNGKHVLQSASFGPAGKRELHPRTKPLAKHDASRAGRGSSNGVFGAFACCTSRDAGGPPESESDCDDVDVGDDDGSAFEATVARMAAAGVPSAAVEDVAKLAGVVAACGDEPLCDPLTLLRFYNARDGDVAAAAAMYDETLRWRREFPLSVAMEKHGSGESYSRDGSRLGEASRWQWRRSTATRDSLLAQKYAFFGRLTSESSKEGDPVAVWRFGEFDMDGCARENLGDFMLQAFASHLEDLLQIGRALSRQRGRLVRCRIIIDMHKLSLGVIKHRAMFRKIVSIGKAYFPEVSASITIIRAPDIFARVFVLARPVLTPVMQRKICILGEDFEAGLLSHAGVSRNSLPAFLKGDNASGDICECGKIPLNVMSLKQ
eukprot:TRINITY_DN22703_c0_g1_i1.p1 TRINITY_DN22703_c0_g1~~TRINITY_DN22703_c0_g1_i1.p1  ORF type:complete len:440 (+),score=81.86 TRINITY_DN22703_c0_g1_i1:46-1320(+)